MPSLADIIREERRHRGWSQHELCIRMGESHNAITVIERGSRTTDLDKLYRIALAFTDGDKEQAKEWLYRLIEAAGYPLPTPVKEHTHSTRSLAGCSVDHSRRGQTQQRGGCKNSRPT
jgi:transcriptional regulator with XRE-family HTH domain